MINGKKEKILATNCKGIFETVYMLSIDAGMEKLEHILAQE